MLFNIAKTTYMFNYDTNSPIILIIARSDDLKHKVVFEVPYKPYFFINKSDYHSMQIILGKKNLLWKIDSVEEDVKIKGVFNSELIKVNVKNPKYIREIRKAIEPKIKTYESDVLFTNRFLIDTGLKVRFEIDDNLVMVGNQVMRRVRVFPEQLKPIEIPNEEIGHRYKFRHCFIDIEVKTKTISDLETYSGELICATIYDPDTKTYNVFYQKQNGKVDNLEVELLKEGTVVLNYYKYEHQLLDGMISFLKQMDYDYIISYTDFDLNYFLCRCILKKRNLNMLSSVGKAFIRLKNNQKGIQVDNLLTVEIPDLQVIDFAESYIKMKGEPMFLNLDFISKTELGIGKIEINNVTEEYEKDIKKLIQYNIRDVELIRMIEDKLGLLKVYVEPIKDIVGCNIDSVFTANRIADILYLRLTRKKGIALYTKPLFPVTWKKPEYEGAMVFPPISGRFKNIAIMDWSELYPSIIETFNIGWNTYRSSMSSEDDICVFGDYFTTKELSWSTEILDPLRRYRREIKKIAKSETDPEKKIIFKSLSNSLKAIINAVYGLYGFAGEAGKYPASRLYSPKIAEKITLLGKHIETEGKKIIESLGYQVIRGDTDSLFIPLKEYSQEEALKLKEIVESKIKEYIMKTWNVKEPKIQLELDKINKVFLSFGVKKRYHSPDEIKGVEAVRRDVADITVILQKQIGSFLLEYRDQEALDYFKKVIRTALDGKLELQSIMVRGKCTKKLDDYKVKARNVKAMENAKKVLKDEIKEGDRFYWIYLKDFTFNGEKMDVIASSKPTLPDYLLDYIDWESMIEYTIIRPLENYFSLINVDVWRIYRDVIDEKMGQYKLSVFIK